MPRRGLNPAFVPSCSSAKSGPMITLFLRAAIVVTTGWALFAVAAAVFWVS